MKLSVIMPCYNVQNTLSRAMESILMQDVDFDYEVIIVNDASTDNTLGIAKDYEKKYKNIKVVDNRVNSGNARSFYNGLSEAKGDYFCVLDGDDYYTIRDKFKRQVNFLDKDEDEEYVAVATQYIIDLGDGQVSVPARSSIKEFTYVDFLTMNAGYYHTATYMYRNIFRGNIPEYFKMGLYRGDTPRTTFHLMYSGKKVRVLDFVGSAYTFEFNGIWSSMKEKQQLEYQVNYLNQHREYLVTDYETQNIDKSISINKTRLKNASDHVRKFPGTDIENCFINAQAYARKFAFEQAEFINQEIYYFDYLDSLCASLGYVWRIHHPDHVQKIANNDSVCIVGTLLNPEGDAATDEIVEIINAHKTKKIFLFITNSQEVPSEIINLVKSKNNVFIISPPEDEKSKLSFFLEKFVEISPFRAYYYCSNDDVYAQAIMHSGVCQNVCLFSFDRGYLCGISNSNIDFIIARRPVDYYMLNKKFGEKVIYIPNSQEDAKIADNLAYSPFCNHKNIITATGAPKYDRFNNCPPYRYEDNIIELLKYSGGTHYHYGEIPNDKLEEIYDRLLHEGISRDKFVVIPWTDKLPQDLLLRNIDVFIEPFPIISYRLTLSVMSVGVPIMAFDGIKRLSIADFIPKGSLKWRNTAEFVARLTTLNKSKLLELSREVVSYLKQNHCADKILTSLRDCEEFCTPEYINCVDSGFRDITEYSRLFSNQFRISIIDGIK